MEQTSKSNRTKKRTVGLILKILVALLCLAAIGVAIHPREIFGDSVADSFLGQDVPNGWVAMGRFFSTSLDKFVITAVTLLIVLVVITIASWIVNLSFHTNARTKTVGSLIKSLIRYASIIIGAGVILAAWGVNIASIVAGVGILTLVIGLGCQSLVNDVVSGVFIVFDDYFSVGDMVIIDGFRGEVSEMGLRTTKLKDASGNIKAITNSSINTVVNLSRENTMVTVEIDLSFNEDLRRVEAILSKNLPEISKAIPQAIGGIFYKGVSGFDECGVKLLFLTFCKEGDKFQVSRDINREIYLLFTKESITIPFKQVVVNGPDPTDHPKATQEEVEEATKVNNELRGIVPEKKPAHKKNVMERAVDNVRGATEKTRKEMK